MITEKGVLIIVIVLILVIVFNVGIFISTLSRSTREQLRMLNTLARQARNPWQKDAEALEQLRSEVAKLNSQDEADEQTEE